MRRLFLLSILFLCAKIYAQNNAIISLGFKGDVSTVYNFQRVEKYHNFYTGVSLGLYIDLKIYKRLYLFTGSNFYNLLSPIKPKDNYHSYIAGINAPLCLAIRLNKDLEKPRQQYIFGGTSSFFLPNLAYTSIMVGFESKNESKKAAWGVSINYAPPFENFLYSPFKRNLLFVNGFVKLGWNVRKRR